MSKLIFFLLSIVVECLIGFIAIRFFGVSDEGSGVSADEFGRAMSPTKNDGEEE